MGATLDLYIDTATGELISGGSVNGGALPTLTRNDSYTLRLRLMERQINGAYNDIDLTGATLKVGIGGIEDTPSDGAFKLITNGVTSGEISYNAAAVSVYNAISGNVSTVSLYGGQSYGHYLLTATQPNTALSFASDSFTLFPSSTILINTRRNPATGIYAQQTVQLIKNPVVYADTFINAPTASEATLTKVNDGSATQNETYELTLGNTVRGGLFSLNFGGNSTTGIAPLTSAITVQTQLSAVTAIGTGNISVQENGKQGYTIQFVGSKGLTNITTALVFDPSGLDFIPLRQTSLTMNTSELADAFAEAGADSITSTLEIELTQNESPKTIYQGSVTIRKDLITVGQTVPASQAFFYSAADSDARYVSRIGDVGFYSSTPISKPASTNVVSALVNLGLISTSVTLNDPLSNYTAICISGNVVTIADGVPISLGTTTGTKIGTATTQKIGFFNATPVSQPTSTNIVSAMVNLGLVASSVTIGNVLLSSNTNIDAANRILFDSNPTRSIDYQNRALYSSGGITMGDFSSSTELRLGYSPLSTSIVLEDSVSVSFGSSAGSKIGTSTNQKLAFFNSTPVTQPAGPNVVSNVISLGLIASSSTYGVLPNSVETLTETATINYGTLTANTTSAGNVTVTGAATGDIVLVGLPAAVSAGVIVQGVVFAANTVCMTAINATTASRTIGSASYRITVIGY